MWVYPDYHLIGCISLRNIPVLLSALTALCILALHADCKTAGSLATYKVVLKPLTF